MHTSAGAACGRHDDGGDAPELYVCGSFPISKVKELVGPVNERIREAKSGPFPQQVDRLSRFNGRLKREARELNLIVWESSRHRRGSAMEGKVRKMTRPGRSNLRRINTM